MILKGLTFRPAVLAVSIGSLLVIIATFAVSGQDPLGTTRFWCVYSVAFSPDGRFAAASMENGTWLAQKHVDIFHTVELIGIEPGAPRLLAYRYALPDISNFARRDLPKFRFLNGGKHFAVQKSQLTTLVWDIAARRQWDEKQVESEARWTFCDPPDGKLYVEAVDWDGCAIRDRSTADDRHNLSFKSPRGWEEIKVALTHDRKQVVMTCASGLLAVWETAEWKLVHEFPGIEEERSLLSLEVSDNGCFAAVVAKASIRVHDLETGAVRVTRIAAANPLDFHDQAVFLPGQTVLATAGSYGLQLVDVTTGAVLQRTPAPADRAFTCVAVSADGSQIATGDSRGEVTTWETSELRLLRRIEVSGGYRVPWAYPLAGAIIWLLMTWFLWRGGLLTTRRKRAGDRPAGP